MAADEPKEAAQAGSTRPTKLRNAKIALETTLPVTTRTPHHHSAPHLRAL